MKNKLKSFLETFQDTDGKFVSDNPVKSTAEYLLVHRFCPQIQVGDTGRARQFLIDNLPHFAFYDVKKGFEHMEYVWQIAVGIPEETLHLSEKFLDLSVSCLPASVKSSLLLVLFMQNVRDRRIEHALQEVMEYQRKLFEKVSLETLYETTHNLMTFSLAKEHYTREIIVQSCVWLSENAFFYSDCIDLLAETVGAFLLCEYKDQEFINKSLSLLIKNQNEDGGFPVFKKGRSEFHSSLVGLWALTASECRRQC